MASVCCRWFVLAALLTPTISIVIQLSVVASSENQNLTQAVGPTSNGPELINGDNGQFRPTKN